ncbi:MAG: pyruvate kinase [Gemmataceae bacterium]|nr:pyruvate kinase [Gemmataceae bacterium]
MTQQSQHNQRLGEPDQCELKNLIRELSTLHSDLLELEIEGMDQATNIHASYQRSARNLLHYLALRRHDIRQLQDRLSALGLSSLDRSESHVRATVEAVLQVLHRLDHRAWQSPQHHEQALSSAEGKALLKLHTEALLGPEPAHRRVRIMVTMPSEAADDPQLVRALLESGMDCARINCAHDDADVWERILAHLRSAERALGKQCAVLMDLAGPKLRTGPIGLGAPVTKWKPQRDEYGRVTAPARIWLYPEGSTGGAPPGADACLPLPWSWLATLCVGDRIDFVDAREARRFLWVVRADGDGRWAEAVRTAYVTPGTELTIVSRAASGPSLDETTARVGDLPPGEQALILNKGDLLILTKDLLPGCPAKYGDKERKELLAPARIGCTLPDIFEDVRVGERIWLDDGKIGGIIESVETDEIRVRITHARARGEKLRADKGINLPDSSLRLPALTEKDIADLPFLAAHADLVGYSFVRSAADVYELEANLAKVGGEHLGIVLKIETRRAFEQLPNLLLASMRTPRDGVMIARGDLAIECGYERMAEVQEEILWICEAAHMPVIWATQVLEGLAKEGQPSRPEISDAVLGQRAECVMLNKGPHILQAVRTLDDILRRMQAHQNKKHSMLRPLELARRFPAR